MNDLPDGLDVGALPGVLLEGWGVDVATIEYAPLGFGSYHWIATDRDGTHRFITVDDLDRKPWFGDGPDIAFAGLTRAYGTALALRDGGLEFVLAPSAATDGRVVRRIDDRYSIAVFPFVEGESGRFGEFDTPEQRAAVIAILGQLHERTAVVASIVPRRALDLPGRDKLEGAVRALDRPWAGGPYSERAQGALALRVSDVTHALDRFDRLRCYVEGRSSDWVVTHGEPHAANVIWAGGGPLLIDWDTVALAPSERDLWMVLDGSEDATVADKKALDFYGMSWDLADVAQYVDVLRSPHRDSEDTAASYRNLLKDLAALDRWSRRLT